jgi:hypothetical protein
MVAKVDLLVEGKVQRMGAGKGEGGFSQKVGPNMSVVAKLCNRSPYFAYNALFKHLIEAQLHTKPPICFSQKLGLVLSKFNELLHTWCQVCFGEFLRQFFVAIYTECEQLAKTLQLFAMKVKTSRFFFRFYGRL